MWLDRLFRSISPAAPQDEMPDQDDATDAIDPEEQTVISHTRRVSVADDDEERTVTELPLERR